MSQKTGGIRVFVYGTLKRLHYNHYLLEGPNNDTTQYKGRARLVGNWRMVSMGNFPGVQYVANQENKAPIYGEVYQISEDTLAALDLLEGNGSFYTRMKVPTPYKNAWIYCLPNNPEYDARPHIPEGVWRPSKSESVFVAKGVDTEDELPAVLTA